MGTNWKIGSVSKQRCEEESTRNLKHYIVLNSIWGLCLLPDCCCPLISVTQYNNGKIVSSQWTDWIGGRSKNNNNNNNPHTMYLLGLRPRTSLTQWLWLLPVLLTLPSHPKTSLPGAGLPLSFPRPNLYIMLPFWLQECLGPDCLVWSGDSSLALPLSPLMVQPCSAWTLSSACFFP